LENGADPLRPIFILCTARSGSTLLRILLDAHPEIACPPELNLCNIFEAISFSTNSVAAGDDEHGAGQRLATALSREVTEAIVAAYPKRAAKTRWCDKSLASIEKPELILSVYPEAQFICLYRECADTAASIKEACEWGYGGYGVEPYARMYAHNMAMALCMYWADRVSAERKFEDEHPAVCLRIRYEDLVAEPEQTLGGLFDFLDVERTEREICSPGALASAGSPMPGDFKIRYTEKIDTHSVGRGWQVPAEMLEAELVERINQLASELGYDPLLSNLGSLPAPTTNGSSEPLSAAVEEIDQLLLDRAPERLALGAHRRSSNAVDSRVRIMFADGREPWLIDFGQARVERGALDGGWTIFTDTETLLEIVHRRLNPAVALRRSRLRLASEGAAPPEQFLRQLDALMAVLAD
jgi:protein-tyrosine sulfotransferase